MKCLALGMIAGVAGVLGGLLLLILAGGIIDAYRQKELP